MPAPTTYSFLDVNAAITGPGGAFSLGSGAANSEEGINVEPHEDIDTLQVGADGSPMHSLNANKSGKVTVSLLKTSPVNALLAAMLAFQRTSGANHGQNTISIVNKSSGDAITCQLCAFARVPNVSYKKNGENLEWTFNAGIIDLGLGAGVA
jgi:Bacteriophage KPP10, Structural protein ORF10